MHQACTVAKTSTLALKNVTEQENVFQYFGWSFSKKNWQMYLACLIEYTMQHKSTFTL